MSSETNEKIEEIKKLGGIIEIIEQCGQTAKEHGFWDVHAKKAVDTLLDSGVDVDVASRAVGSLTDAQIIGDPFIFLGLIATEAAEAMEACRRGNWRDKDGVWEELADVVIRIFDFVCRFNYGSTRSAANMFRDVILNKMAINENRPYLHGKKF